MGRLQRHSAGRAAALAKELHLRPARRAKAVHLIDDCAAAGAAWRKCEIKHLPQTRSNERFEPHSALVAAHSPPHKRTVTTELFDRDLLAIRRARARRRGTETFLRDRALEDIFERLS